MKDHTRPKPEAAEDKYATSQSTGFLVRKAHRSFSRSLEKRLKEHGISISMWYFLRLLWQKDGLSQKQCSEELNLTQPTTVAAMDNLERKGLVRRVRNGKDRRMVNIFLTDKGRRLRAEIIHYVSEVNSIATAGLSDWELQALHSILARVTTALEQDIERS